jgi:hypothetical protein
VAILKSPPRPPKNETLQIRVEEEIRAKLHKYAEFIYSSEFICRQRSSETAVSKRQGVQYLA